MQAQDLFAEGGTSKRITVKLFLDAVGYGTCGEDVHEDAS